MLSQRTLLLKSVNNLHISTPEHQERPGGAQQLNHRRLNNYLEPNKGASSKYYYITLHLSTESNTC